MIDKQNMRLQNICEKKKMFYVYRLGPSRRKNVFGVQRRAVADCDILTVNYYK